MKKEDDMYLAILAYRMTPTEIGYSPAELLMNRKLCTTVPMLPELRKPTVIDPSLVVQKDANLILDRNAILMNSMAPEN